MKKTRMEYNHLNSNRYFVHPDHLGSWTLVTDHNGTIQQDVCYDAWGSPYRFTATGTVPATSLLFDRGFTGHEHMTHVGLINMNGRVYDPILGRMLSPDVLIQDEQSSQAYNRYSYCFNNPLRFTDPSGYVVRGMHNYYDWNSMVYYDFGNYRSNGGAFNTDLSEGKAVPINDNYTVDNEGYIRLVEIGRAHV